MHWPPSRRGFAAITASALVAGLLVPRAAWQGEAALHTLIEGVATCLALTVGSIAWVRYASRREPTFLFVATGFVGTGLLDAYHTLVTSVWVVPQLPSPMVALVPWSWLASRIFLGGALLAAWWAWRRPARRLAERQVIAVAGLWLVASVLVFLLLSLPAGRLELGLVHRPQELVPGLFFLVALGGWIAAGTWREQRFDRWLIGCLILNCVAQLTVMTRSAELFDAPFEVAHLLKVASYGAVFGGLLVDIRGTFREVLGGVDELGRQQAALEKEVARRARVEAELLAQARELERSNAELERFAYVASHDLQEPLRMVTSYLELLESRYGDRLDDDARDFIGFAVDGARRMKALIRSLLAYSRAGAGAVGGTASAESAVDRAVANLEVALAESGGVVERGRLPRVPIDEMQLVQVFQNLIGNALKFRSAEPPRVVVEATVDEDGGWRIAVRDNGIGFEPEYRERIFGLFQRLRRRDTHSGTGMGLAISRKILRSAGGDLVADSRPGAGSTFTLVLPAHRGDESDAA